MSAESLIVEPQIRVSRLAESALLLKLSGSWRLHSNLPYPMQVQKEILSELPIKRIAFDTDEINEWDTGLLTFLSAFIERCNQRHIGIDMGCLPTGVRQLLDLAFVRNATAIYSR